MDSERQKRKKEIQKALAFIESSLAYPDPDSCTGIVSQLVFNLLVEGNALFKDKECDQAVKEFSEGLGVVQYAASEAMHIPAALVESLYVNRATVYYSMGEFERGVQDCEQALEVNKGSSKALYRKALCLKELGRYREAYDCTTDCLLVTRLVRLGDTPPTELRPHRAPPPTELRPPQSSSPLLERRWDRWRSPNFDLILK